MNTDPNDGLEAFSRWRKKNLYKLRLWLPSGVVESDRRLGYVLLHAEDHQETGWPTDWLPPLEARAFLTFLEQDFPDNPIGYEIFVHLRKRADKQA